MEQMIREIEKGLFHAEIELPDNPLKWLNCYVLKGSCLERNLLIDTGFHHPSCTEALLGILDDLCLSPENTDVFLTHMHSDHTGNAWELSRLGYRLLMGECDHKLICGMSRDKRERQSRRLGIPDELFDAVVNENAAVSYAPIPFDAKYISDGQVLEYGGRQLKCLLMPGHTPGLFCLYDAEHQLLFSSDHILFDITPNIMSWTELDDSLGAYIDSLKRIRELPVKTCLPSHRTGGGMSMEKRIQEILTHHEHRLLEIYLAVKKHPGATAYTLASFVRWRTRIKDWDAFPPGQKWFAVGEVMAHLEYLERRGILCEVTNTENACCWHIASK